MSATGRTVRTQISEHVILLFISSSVSKFFWDPAERVSSERSGSLELLQRVPVVLIHVVRLQETGIRREGAEDLPQLLVRHAVRAVLQPSEQELLQI